jgi:hypothetical protein
VPATHQSDFATVADFLPAFGGRSRVQRFEKKEGRDKIVMTFLPDFSLHLVDFD